MSQPLNTSITIQRRVRTKRDIGRNDSIATMTKHLAPEIVVVPGQEITSGVLTRDADFVDFSPYMGEASHVADRGFPIVVGALPKVTLGDLADGVSDLDYMVVVGPDKHFHKVDDAISDDLFGEVGSL